MIGATLMDAISSGKNPEPIGNASLSIRAARLLSLLRRTIVGA